MAEQRKARGIFAGVANIVRFNPLYFLGAGSVISIAIFAVLFFSSQFPAWIVAIVSCGVILAAWWFLLSLIASWWIYDLSALYRWTWLAPEMVSEAEMIAVAHAGFDEVSEALQRRFCDRKLHVLDFHDPERMTERSIQRARRLCPPVEGTQSVGIKSWRLSFRPDLVLFPLSLHELRLHEERVSILIAAKHELAAGGTILLLEHLRDPANFIAFGPGFLHFYSAKTWQKAWQGAGLQLRSESRVTPFLKCFVLSNPHNDQ